MASLEEQFEQALTEIMLGSTGQHLLEAEAVTECVVNGEIVTITLDLPDDDALRQEVASNVEDRIGKIDGISAVKIRMAGEAGNGSAAVAEGVPREPQRPEKQVYLQNYGAVIAVSSGKGGVGKSTVAVNLAITLTNMGHKVSLFDADVYGPSVPIMLGLRDRQPIFDDHGITPLKKYGLHVMSVGNVVEEAAAAIWRGPIVHQILDQLLRETRWPGGDFMIIDMPPGTGDAQLTISQVLELAGAIVVSTPQDVALLDAMKGVTMFNKVEVPILGVVENMSTFICPSCETETAIFDTGNAKNAAEEASIPFLGAIPIEPSIREGGDTGKPVCIAREENATTQAFKTIAENLIAALNNQ